VGAGQSEPGIVARDLNHDLMAAGHPRLNFELAVYRMNEPPHWRADKYKDDPAYEAKVWPIGQAVAARASLELLAHRAELAQNAQGPWPEFAETDCFACHADLREHSWRRSQAYYQGRIPGRLPYSRWYSTMLSTLAPLSGGAEQEVLIAFGNLAQIMSQPSPPPKSVLETARKAMPSADKLIEALKTAKLDAATVQAMLAIVRSRKAQTKEMRWEEVEQLALAAAALHHADLTFKKQPRDEKAAKALADLFQALSFPPGYESPHTFRRGDALEKVLDEVLAKP
jgi:hypothetical protein